LRRWFGSGPPRRAPTAAKYARLQQSGQRVVFARVEYNLAHELLDIPPADVAVGKVPVPPVGYEIVRVDVVVRLRRKTINSAPNRKREGRL
jgi:hypothetical protein